MPTLPVPYISQLGAGATWRNNDCGAASGLMILKAYKPNVTLTVDDFYRLTGQTADAYLSASQIAGVLSRYGIDTDWTTANTTGNLYMALSDRRPAMLLMNYGILVDAGLTQFSNFRGSHFVVAVGADIESVYIHDPYRSDNSGQALAVPMATFALAWSELLAQGNPPRGMLVPEARIGDEIESGNQYQVLYPMNVRNGPGTNWKIVGALSTGAYVNALELQGDWARIGAYRWLYIGNTSWVRKV